MDQTNQKRKNISVQSAKKNSKGHKFSLLWTCPESKMTHKESLILTDKCGKTPKKSNLDLKLKYRENKRHKSLKEQIDLNILRRKDMTYILGARCKDGVVLVGDTKITIDGGADYAYAKKLKAPLNNIFMGAAGIGGLYKDFQNRIIAAVAKMEREKEEGEILPITREEEFSVLVNKIIREMHRDYDQDRHILGDLMILCATRIGADNAELTTFSPYGFPEPVNEIKVIGHGEPYGALFVKKMWQPGMTMEQTAKIGLFVIKLLRDMDLDNSVGFNEKFLPQVVYVPDIQIPPKFDIQNQDEVQKLLEKYPIKEVSEEKVKNFINEISSKISDLENFFQEG